MKDEIQAANIDSTRRRFIEGGAAMAVAAVTAAAAGSAVAAEQMGHEGHEMPGTRHPDGIRFKTDDVVCATCVFWGGLRKVEKGGGVLATSLGTCSNPKSPNYQKMTGPAHIMVKTVWRKWPALG